MNIFNDVVEGISKEVSKVQERSQEMLQGFNINSQIKDLERKKGKKLKELGELVFNKFHKDEDVSEDAIKEKVSEVVGFQDQINVLQAELDAADIQRDPNASQSSKSAAKAGYTPTPGFECPACGTPVSRDKKFCPACGYNLKGDDDKVKDSEPIDVEAEVEEDENKEEESSKEAQDATEVEEDKE